VQHPLGDELKKHKKKKRKR